MEYTNITTTALNECEPKSRAYYIIQNFLSEPYIRDYIEWLEKEIYKDDEVIKIVRGRIAKSNKIKQGTYVVPRLADKFIKYLDMYNAK